MMRAFAGERCITASFLQNPDSRDISSLSGGPSVTTPLISLYKVVGLADVDAMLFIDYMTKYMEAMQLEPNKQKAASEAIEAEAEKTSKNPHTFSYTPTITFKVCRA